MGVWLLTVALARAQCADTTPLVAELERAATEGRLGEGEMVKVRLMAALACGPVAPPELLARMWLADAVMLSLRGDEDGATDAIAAAARVAPEVWNDVYGPEFHRRHLAAQGLDTGMGHIVFDVAVEGELPVGRPVITVVDGEILSDVTPAVPSGLHVAQIGFGSGDVRFAQEVFVVAGQDLVVRSTLVGVVGTPVPDPDQSLVPGTTPVPVPSKLKRFPAFLVAAGVTGIGAGVTAGAALGQNGAMRAAETRDALDGAFRTQKALGYTSYALVGATAACLTLEVAL